MAKAKLPQKLIAFSLGSTEFEKIKQDMQDGWNIINLTKNGNYFVGIMEQADKTASNDSGSVFFPPKKKIKLSH